MEDTELEHLKDSLQQVLQLLPETALVGLVTFGTHVMVHELSSTGTSSSHPPTHPPTRHIQHLIPTASLSSTQPTHPPTHPPRMRPFLRLPGQQRIHAPTRPRPPEHRPSSSRPPTPRDVQPSTLLRRDGWADPCPGPVLVSCGRLFVHPGENPGGLTKRLGTSSPTHPPT